MTSTVVGLLSIAAALQGLSVSIQILMQRKGVGFLLRSPFGTVLNMLAEWFLRRGSRNLALNTLRQRRWLAAEVSRTVVCGYFEYPAVLKLSLKDILMLVLYGISYETYKLAFGPKGGIVEWLVLVAIIVVAYYGMVTLWILTDLGSKKVNRSRLFYITSTIFRGRAYSTYMRDLMALGMLPKEMTALAQKSRGLGWWAREYWNVETHKEKAIVVEIIQRMLEYEGSKAEVREQKRHSNSASGIETFVKDGPVDSLEGVLSPLDSQFARRLRIKDPEFRSMIAHYDTHPDGSKGQRRELKKIIDYMRQQLVVKE
jgi:hypothetical protein